MLVNYRLQLGALYARYDRTLEHEAVAQVGRQLDADSRLGKVHAVGCLAEGTCLGDGQEGF